jgi:predicted nucleic acid-binding protein
MKIQLISDLHLDICEYIGSLDTMIGAHALSLNVTLVTNNTREFDRIAGLKLADWIGH